MNHNSERKIESKKIGNVGPWEIIIGGLEYGVTCSITGGVF